MTLWNTYNGTYSEIFNEQKPLIIFEKGSVMDICQGCKYAFDWCSELAINTAWKVSVFGVDI